ncbi:MAG: sulfatase-like hydrolase/transferase [Planctomycetes bacterium]|nr:sulfatase-like hydrolase/transferase [Planctomycetota bacterium]
MRILTVLAASLVAGLALQLAAQDARPNVVWITAEDHGPDLGCYGCAVARTPRLDALAAQGVRYTRAWSGAPVCSTARTTLITGCYPQALGAEHHRSRVPAPDWLEPLPVLLRRAGYFCSNNSKTDYNLEFAGAVWDESNGRAHWRHRAAGQPFFAVFNFTQSHESQLRKRPHDARLDPAEVVVPPQHPDLPEVRQDWAQYHDQLAVVDAAAGRVLDELGDDDLADDTVVFYFADHGAGLPGFKRSATDAGLHVPLLVRVPPRLRAASGLDVPDGAATDRLVSFVDLAPTVLSLCGVGIPDWMHGEAFLGARAAAPRELVHGYRGRMDERLDLVRCVSDGRWLYMRNLLPRLPAGQHYAYMFETPTTRAWYARFVAGELDAVQSRYWLPRPAEELYDLAGDPGETRDLAGEAEHAEILARLRSAWRRQALRIGDLDLLPESELDRRAHGRPPAALTAGDRPEVDVGLLLVAAERATGAEPLAADGLARGLEHPDAGVRYWMAQGLLHRGEVAVREHAGALARALTDPSPAVRIVAAEALARFADEPRALTVLLDCATPARHGWWAAVEAFNALDRLAGARAPAREVVEALDIGVDAPPGRGPELLQRLREETLRGCRADDR